MYHKLDFPASQIESWPIYQAQWRGSTPKPGSHAPLELSLPAHHRSTSVEHLSWISLPPVLGVSEGLSLCICTQYALFSTAGEQVVGAGKHDFPLASKLADWTHSTLHQCSSSSNKNASKFPVMDSTVSFWMTIKCSGRARVWPKLVTSVARMGGLCRELWVHSARYT